MSSVALAPTAVSRPAVNSWFVATAVVVPTFMEILDTTIATASMRYIAGGLSASMVDSDWVMTSYLAANATILPITGWISARLGRRKYFLLSIAVFTIASVLCGLATSLGQLILFRVIQGLAGGGLQPASQGVLIDAFPPEKQGTAMTMFGVAGLIAPVIGPTLGGYITVNYNWRWIFLINLPIGVAGYLMCHFAVDDPDYLKKERAELSRQPLNFDYIGLGLLALAMICWEVLLSKGQEWDWYNDPFWKVQTLFILFVLCLGGLVVREMRIANPVVNFRPLGERNLAASSIIIFCAYGVLYGASVSLPSLLQSLFGYDAFVSGLVMSPSGVFSILIMLVVGVLLGRGTDARWLIAAGLLVMAAGNYWMARMNLYISPNQVVWPRVVLICGLSLLFAPINVAAFRYTPQHLRGAAVGLFALLRNEGGSVGMSIGKIIEQRREQFHLARVGENLSPLNSHVQSFFSDGQAFFMQRTGDPAGSRRLTLQALDDLRQQQAASLAYFDVFWLFAVLCLGLVLLVFLMKRSVAEKGELIGGE
ncbi:MAG TPA: DHA2 family efflux MFS transporter permease subunit [Isosphaeraceae bacterium]|nr:DHA2 family efflux MFS transporter permease subunit [Isosphaeraceae bacterium]